MNEIKQLISQLQNTNSRTEKELILSNNRKQLEFLLTFLCDKNIITGLSTKKIQKEVPLQSISKLSESSSQQSANLVFTNFFNPLLSPFLALSLAFSHSSTMSVQLTQPSGLNKEGILYPLCLLSGYLGRHSPLDNI